MPQTYAYFLPHAGMVTSPFSVRNPNRKELYAALEAAWQYQTEDKGKLPHAGVRVLIDENDRFEIRVVKGYCAEDGSVRAIQVPSLLPEPERIKIEQLMRSAIKWEERDA